MASAEVITSGVELTRPAIDGATQGPVDLGAAASFAVLPNSGIINTGVATVLGDIGPFPTPTDTGVGTSRSELQGGRRSGHRRPAAWQRRRRQI